MTRKCPHVINFLDFSQLCYGGLTECYSHNPKLLFHIDASFTFELLRRYLLYVCRSSHLLYLPGLQIELKVKHKFFLIVFLDYIRTLQQLVTVHPMIISTL